jgi:hypothetical protein
VRSGLDALINRAVFYRLVDLAVPREGETGQPGMGIWSGEHFFILNERGSM